MTRSTPKITAKVDTHAQGDNVRARLTIAASLSPDAEARLHAATYRLAAEIAELNIDEGLCIALNVSAHEGTVTIENVDDQNGVETVQALMADALARNKIAATWIS